MFGKYVLSLTALVLLVAVMSIHAAPEAESDLLGEVQPRASRSMKEVVEILQRAFKGAPRHCIEKAAFYCQRYLGNTSKIIKCGGDFIATRC